MIAKVQGIRHYNEKELLFLYKENRSRTVCSKWTMVHSVASRYIAGQGFFQCPASLSTISPKYLHRKKKKRTQTRYVIMLC